MLQARSFAWHWGVAGRELTVMLMAILAVVLLGAAWLFGRAYLTASPGFLDVGPNYEDVPGYLITPGVGPAPV